ncbi:antibiotic biosynthesis monooxygenase [Sphingobacterium sp.]|uniref:putative quinol monooxygenase n=1 Tax=Sphingobacterium sp. TaxID=341027 RepID=UPI00289CCBAC|nr:antibiotic biosynthesis monooxygenase [Sphingobacterium sp.]
MAKYIIQHPCLNLFLRVIILFLALFSMYNIAHAQQVKEPIVRISEIEINSEHLVKYKAILKEEAEASVRLESGVIAIFPMFQKDMPTLVRILEIYQDQQAYQLHLKTAHFLKYKTSTLHMVKSLKLVDMDALDLETAKQIFIKLKK